MMKSNMAQVEEKISLFLYIDYQAIFFLIVIEVIIINIDETID